MVNILLLLASCALGFYVDPSEGVIKDSTGRSIIFHGVNVVYKTPPFIPSDGEFDPELSLNDQDIEYMKEWGFNAVRLGVIWQAVERELGTYDFQYLNKINDLITKLGKAGIYTLVDSHQDLLSNAYCGEGMPTFYNTGIRHSCYQSLLSIGFKLGGLCKSMESYNFQTDKEGNPLTSDCKKNLFYFYYTSPEVNSLFYSLYTNSTIQEAFYNYWEAVASTIGNNPYILGYDLFNEPWPGDFYHKPSLFIPQRVDYEYLRPMYKGASDKIVKHSPHLITFEAVQFPDTFSEFIFPVGFTEPPAENDRSVLNAHTYCCQVSATMCKSGEPPLEQAKTTCRDFHRKKISQRYVDAKRLKVALMVSEFGACSDSEACMEEILGATDVIDELGVSWMYWQYKGYDDITTTGSSTEGLFNKDGSVQTNKVKALTKTYLKATQGQVKSMKFDVETGFFTATYKLDSSITAPTELYFHSKYFYPQGYKLSVINYSRAPEVSQTSNNTLEILFRKSDFDPDTVLTLTPKRKSPSFGLEAKNGLVFDYTIFDVSDKNPQEVYVNVDTSKLEGNYEVEVVSDYNECKVPNETELFECWFQSNWMFKSKVVVYEQDFFYRKVITEFKLPALNGDNMKLEIRPSN